MKAHNIAAFFPLGRMWLHNLCIRAGSKTMEVTVYDTCGDHDCNGCCTRNRGDAAALIDLESFTNARFGVPDGRIEWADLGLAGTSCSDVRKLSSSGPSKGPEPPALRNPLAAQSVPWVTHSLPTGGDSVPLTVAAPDVVLIRMRPAPPPPPPMLFPISMPSAPISTAAALPAPPTVPAPGAGWRRSRRWRHPRRRRLRPRRPR